MKKISYYIIAIIIVAGSTVSFWVYQKYFKTAATTFLQFPVSRGPIQDIVKVRGEVVAQKNFDLEFPSSGIIEQAFVAEGDTVKENAPLIKLDPTDLELEVKRLQAVPGKLHGWSRPKHCATSKKLFTFLLPNS